MISVFKQLQQLDRGDNFMGMFDNLCIDIARNSTMSGHVRSAFARLRARVYQQSCVMSSVKCFHFLLQEGLEMYTFNYMFFNLILLSFEITYYLSRCLSQNSVEKGRGYVKTQSVSSLTILQLFSEISSLICVMLNCCVVQMSIMYCKAKIQR